MTGSATDKARRFRYPPAMNVHFKLLFCFCNLDWTTIGTVASGLGAIASAVIAAFGLLWLIRYANDTKTLARASQDQIEAAEVPFLVVAGVGVGHPLVGNASHVLRNIGNGPALNCVFRLRRPKLFTETRDPAVWTEARDGYEEVGAGDEKALGGLVVTAMEHETHFVLEYESLSGRRYSTTCTRADAEAGDWHTKFERLG